MTARLGRWVFDRLGSVRLAAWLMAALGILSLVAFIVPQRVYLGAAFDAFAEEAPVLARIITALGLDRIYTGWPIAILGGLLSVNLVACTLRRVWHQRRQSSHVGEPPAAIAAAVSEARNAGWDVLRATELSVTLVKGQSGFWGSVLAHAGLLIVIVGGVVTMLTGFRGEMVIAEGQTVPDEPASYVIVRTLPRVGEPFSGAHITLESMDVRYADDVVVSAVARMRAIGADGRVVRKDVRVNHPFEAGGKTYLLQDSGHSVRLVVQHEDAEAIPVAISLAEQTPHGWRDDLRLPLDGEEAHLSLAATPRPVGAHEPPLERKLAIEDPRLDLTIEYRGERWQGVLAPGRSSASVGGLTVTFEGLALWTRFLVRGEPYRWVTFLGFWVVVAGMAWRFMVPERRAVLRMDDDGRVAVKVRTYPWPDEVSGGVGVLGLGIRGAMQRDGVHDEERVST